MVLLGAIAFAAMLCEGATADWAAVYLSGPLHTTGVVPGLGYATFALAMVTVRLSGNRLLTRFRPDRLLPALAAVATAGFAAALLIAEPPAALLGFGCLGIGLASVVPAVFSAAGRIPGLAPGHRRGHRVSLRMGRIRLRPTGHRALVRMGVAARRLGSAAAAHRVRRRRHPHLVARYMSASPRRMPSAWWRGDPKAVIGHWKTICDRRVDCILPGDGSTQESVWSRLL